MYTMLCRNRVKDYATWRKVFESHAAAHREAGLQLTDLWCDVEDPNNVFFAMSVPARGSCPSSISTAPRGWGLSNRLAMRRARASCLSVTGTAAWMR